MADRIAIKTEHLSKTFKLPKERNTSVKSTIINFYRRNRGYEIQQALKDISFEVKEGEFFGIVGRNGSGKSTLLKLLAGIYNPDEGEMFVNGKLTPFIELGVGFNQELTGKENVYLNGALLGFDRKEVAAMYDDIVEFAELERFMDQKLKNYSSGMQVRLAFSVAIRANTDILLIDEVLAVGDANFQSKCINVFKEMKAAGKTIVFISHDMGMIRRFCDRVIMIENGNFVSEGNPDDVAELYEEANIPSASDLKTARMLNREIDMRDQKIITRLALTNDDKKEKSIFGPGETISLKVTLKSVSEAKNLGIAIYTRDGSYVFGTNTINDKIKIAKETNYTFKASLGEGEYRMKIGVFGDTDKKVLEFYENGPTFLIRSDKQNKNGWQGIVELSHKWS